MRFYEDAEWPMDHRWVRAAILEGLRQPQADDGTGRAIEQARDGLIAAGMLEQALADQAEQETAVCEAASLATSLTDAWADRLADAWQGNAGLSGPDHPEYGADSALRHCIPRQASLPEGYLFYGVYPDHYLQVGRRLAAAVGAGPVVVVGVRSIGTSLCAAVSAGLRQAGCVVTRTTVRPAGSPFERVVNAEDMQAREWRAASARGARFVAVDEGPGLSGSSLAATVQALERCGAEPGAVHIVCATPGPMPMATPAIRTTWARCRCWAAEREAGRFWHEQLPEMVGETTGTAVRMIRDLSWGAWESAGLIAAHQPLLPQMERRKILLELDGQPVLAKFIGFGEVGRLKVDLATRLAEAGFTPPVLGYAHGLLLMSWQEQCHPARSGQDADRVIPTAAQYYAYLRTRCAVGAPPLGALAATSSTIARDWLGVMPEMEQMVRAAATGRPLALHGDQRPEPVEWLAGDHDVRKCDGADHFLDHTWARDQDIGFDLAGFSQEFGLIPAQERELIARYVEASGDTGVGARLPLYRCIYAAHKLAGLDTAYHAANPNERVALDVARRQAGAALAAALQGGEAQPCAC